MSTHEVNLTMSNELNEIFAALAKAQGEFPSIKKDSKNPFYNSKYADLASITDATRSHLSNQGLCVIQTMGSFNGTPTLITTLGHSSGQWIRGEMVLMLPRDKQNNELLTPQSYGSSITFFRRYCLQAIINVAAEDDDGEKAEQTYRNKKHDKSDKITPMPADTAKDVVKLNKQQGLELINLLSKCPSEYSDKFYKKMVDVFNTNSVYELPTDMYDSIKKSALKKIAEAQEYSEGVQ